MKNEKHIFFQALNSFFDHIYVITLQRATERHQHISKELDGLKYQFFFGKDKRNFTISQLEKQKVYDSQRAKKNHRYNKPMDDGQIGCAWSHRDVYEDVINKKYRNVLILEDDIVIDTTKVGVFQKAINELPKDWGIIYLGFAGREVKPKTFFLKKVFYHLLRSISSFRLTHEAINNLYPKKIGENLYTAGYHDCTHAYALTNDAAEKLFQLQQPLSYVADHLLSYVCTNKILNGYVILPKIINQQYQLGIENTSYVNE